MGTGITILEIVFERGFPFHGMLHGHRAEAKGAQKHGQGEEEHALVRRKGTHTAEVRGGSLHNQAVEEGKAETGDDGEDDARLRALLLFSSKLAIGHAAKHHRQYSQHHANPKHRLVARESGAEVVEDDAASPAEAAAEQGFPSRQPTHEGQQPGTEEGAREGIDEPLSQGNLELGNGPAEGPGHEERDEAERGEAEAPRDEEAAPAEAELGPGVGDGRVAAHQVRFRQEAGILFPGEEIRPHRDGGEEGEDTQQDSGDDPVFGPPLLVEFSPIGGGTFQFHFFLPFFL